MIPRGYIIFYILFSQQEESNLQKNSAKPKALPSRSMPHICYRLNHVNFLQHQQQVFSGST